MCNNNVNCCHFDMVTTFLKSIRPIFLLLPSICEFADSNTVSTNQVFSVRLVTDEQKEGLNKA